MLQFADVGPAEGLDDVTEAELLMDKNPADRGGATARRGRSRRSIDRALRRRRSRRCCWTRSPADEVLDPGEVRDAARKDLLPLGDVLDDVLRADLRDWA